MTKTECCLADYKRISEDSDECVACGQLFTRTIHHREQLPFTPPMIKARKKLFEQAFTPLSND